ncbi:MAG: rane-associated protein-like protein [Jatrophihabitantaceae bacterium]|nr:rane-associated protein-like protein [Jatrophihabitantaceae bacterium]
MSDGIGLGYLLGLFGLVAFGAVIPVVPTGAAVSVGAALAHWDNPVALLLVVVFGAAGAYTGDVITYGVLRVAGEPLARRVGWLHDGATADTLQRLRHQVEEHELRVLLLSRLVPGGRVPVLLAAALGGYSWRRFVIADIGAAALWASVYSAIGLGGRALFPEPWQAAVAAIALVLVVSVISTLWERRRGRSAPA